MVWGTISSLGAFAEGVGKVLNYPLFHMYEFMVLPQRKTKLNLSTQFFLPPDMALGLVSWWTWKSDYQVTCESTLVFCTSTKARSVNKKNCFEEVDFFVRFHGGSSNRTKKNARLTERKKEQACFHARFLGSAAAASSLAARRRRQA